MKLQDEIRNFHPDTDTDTIADALGVDEDEVIAAIHNTPKITNPHDTIDAWLKTSDFTNAGQVLTGKWADQFIENPSPFSDCDFFEIRKSDPKRRKFYISDELIVVRSRIDGSFYDNQYAIDAEIAELILNLRK